MPLGYSTYSFADIYATIAFPGVPQITINGLGVGEINIARANDNTMHDVAADGVVLVSKIKARNGTLSVSCLQTSPLHTALKKAFSLLENGPAASWSAGSITIASPKGLFDRINCAGVAFVKPADQPYQKQGQFITWNFMAANISML